MHISKFVFTDEGLLVRIIDEPYYVKNAPTMDAINTCTQMSLNMGMLGSGVVPDVCVCAGGVGGGGGGFGRQNVRAFITMTFDLQ